MLRKVGRWIVFLTGATLASGLCAAAWRYVSKPAALAVAVGPPGSEDAELMAVFARALAGNSSARIRLSIDPTSGPRESIAKLTAGQTQLAVARTDGPASEKVRAVAVLHTDPVAIVAADQPKVDDLSDLKGKRFGVVGPPGANDTLIATLRQHYALSGDIRTLPQDPASVASALRDRSIQALILVVPASRSTKVAETWTAVRTASRRKLTFVPIDNAAAIAAVAPAYEAGEIAAGQFGGSPALPTESVTTLQVATYLVADRTVPNDVVIRLTKALFEERQRMAQDAPAANLIKTASTDKDAVFPAHDGARVYYDGEETTLMERYGDWLFYGPVLFGALGSLLLGLKRFLRGADADEPDRLPRLSALLDAVRAAQTLAELAHVRAEVDMSVKEFVDRAGAETSDGAHLARMAVALGYVDRAIAERRELLFSTGGVADGKHATKDAAE